MKWSLVFVATFGVTLALMPPPAKAQDWAKTSGSKEDPVLQMMQNFVRDDVRQVQRTLEKRGYDLGTTDGIMWPATRKALARFQRDEGLQATGRIDAETVARLRATEPAAASPPAD